MLDGRLGSSLPIRLGSVFADTSTKVHGQAQALIITTFGQGFGQAQALIIPPPQGYGQAAAYIVDRYSRSVLHDSPAVFHRLLETSGTTAVNFKAPGTNDATYGTGTTLGVTGPLASCNTTKAITLDGGANDYLDTTNSEYTQPFSLEFWAKATTTITAHAQSGSGTAGTSGQKYIWFPVQKGTSSGLGVSLGTNGIAVYEHGNAFLAPVTTYYTSLGTTWHYYVIVRSSGTAKIYVDGVLQATGVNTGRTVFAPTLVGQGTYGNFAGDVAEVAVYGSALTEARIADHYSDGICATRNSGFGQAQAYISPGVGTQIGQAQADIFQPNPRQYGQAQAFIVGAGWGHSQAQAYVSRNLTQWIGSTPTDHAELLYPNINSGATSRTIVGPFVADETGLWTFWLSVDDSGGLVIRTSSNVSTTVVTATFSNSPRTGTINLTAGQVYVLSISYTAGGAPNSLNVKYSRPSDGSNLYWLTDHNPPWTRDNHMGWGQAQAKIGHLHHAQAQATILQATRVFAQAQARLITTDYPRHGQAQGYIIVRDIEAFGQAQAEIVYKRWSFAQAQGTIIRAFPGDPTEPGTQPGYPNFGPPEYVVVYNGLQLPGYAQTETLINEMRLADFNSWDWDGSRTQQAGLNNFTLSMDFLIYNTEGWRAVKDKYDYAQKILFSQEPDDDSYKPLYIDYTDRHWMALVKNVSYDKTAYETRRTLRYTVDFECRPDAIAETAHTITGTGTITTDQVGRTFDNGGWTPARLTITGTNVTVSGYTATDFTGYINVSGVVSNLVIDTATYTSTHNGENANHLMRWVDYAMYVGPGKTSFAITGASSVSITYYDRWY